VPAIVVGDPVRLPGPGNRSFLGIYTHAQNARTALVIVHGYGVNPDWGMIGELRSSLADAGYTTLSIQMPVLAVEANPVDYVTVFPDAAQRIAAAVDYLHGKGYRTVALVSHSMGSRMSNEYLASIVKANAPEPPVAAWVAIGLPVDYREAARFRFPVFDLYGENDLPAVLNSAARRAESIKPVRGSKTMKVPGADHFFNGRYKELDAAVRDYLNAALR